MGSNDETVLQGGRAKAYRPIAESARREALAAGLAAYERGDWFLAHELLEPAWMGTRELAERELLQGLIKLAAAFVHGARANPAGVAKNLRGARARISAGVAAGERTGIDAAALLAAVDAWLAFPGGPAIKIPRLGKRDAGSADGDSQGGGAGQDEPGVEGPGNGGRGDRS